MTGTGPPPGQQYEPYAPQKMLSSADLNPTPPTYIPQSQQSGQIHTNGQAVLADNSLDRREYGGAAGGYQKPPELSVNEEYYRGKQQQELYDPHAEYGGAPSLYPMNAGFTPAGFNPVPPMAVPPPAVDAAAKKASKKDRKKKKKRQRSSSSSSSSSSSDSSDSDSKSKGKRKSVSRMIAWNRSGSH